MRKRNKTRWLPLIASCASLSNCATKPPDVPVCEDLVPRLSQDKETGHIVQTASPTCAREVGEISCGHCVLVVSGREFFVGEGKDHLLNGKPWSQIKASSVLLPAVESYAPLAEYVLDSCKRVNCDSDVTRFTVKLDAIPKKP